MADGRAGGGGEQGRGVMVEKGVITDDEGRSIC